MVDTHCLINPHISRLSSLKLFRSGLWKWAVADEGLLFPL